MQDSTIIEVLTEEKPLAQLKLKKYVLNNWQRPTSYKPGQSEGLLLSKGMDQQNVNEWVVPRNIQKKYMPLSAEGVLKPT